jgi:signal transduction histidine kinase
MNWLNNISLKHKLIGLVLFITSTVTVAGYTVVLFRFAAEQERKFVLNVETNAVLLADYCVGPMSFNDSIETTNILSRIENLPDILSASVYTSDSSLFARYQLTSSVKNEPENEQIEEVIRHKIQYKEIDYGYIVLIASRESITKDILRFAITNGGWLLFLLFLGTFAAYRLQFVITRPLAKLSAASRKISLEADYSIRLQREGRDEISVVYNAFNKMLEQIEKRDDARDLVEQNLQKAKERAEQADYLKTSFLTNMSHEIRTPMNAILGFTNLLIEEDLPQEQRQEYLKVINESGNTLLNLVNDILDISKIEAGQLAIAKANCDINEIFIELYISFNEIKAQKKKEHIDIVINNPFANRDLVVRTDPFRLRQVFVNLLGNALKFTDKGSIELGVIPINNMLEFYVEDTGIGINEGHMEEIFHRFRKIDEEKSRLYRGAGLGLAICKDIVQLLGGDISVESAVGEGSTFRFTIPFDQVDAVGVKTNTVESKVLKRLDLSDKTILIAEDEPNNFEFLNQLLQKYNATIVWARNGEEAIRRVSEQQFDLVLMDVKMPKIDGYEATRKIKTLFPKLRIIAQTAYTSPEEIEKCLESGCDYYVSKPIKLRELDGILRKVWRN